MALFKQTELEKPVAEIVRKVGIYDADILSMENAVIAAAVDRTVERICVTSHETPGHNCSTAVVGHTFCYARRRTGIKATGRNNFQTWMMRERARPV